MCYKILNCFKTYCLCLIENGRPLRWENVTEVGENMGKAFNSAVHELKNIPMERQEMYYKDILTVLCLILKCL